MQIVLTDERDERFLELSNKLNEEYLENVGDVALNYQDHNSLDEPHFVALAMNWDKAIACASFKVCSIDSVEIKRVYVTKRHRRKGIAYQLVKQLEKLAFENGFKYFYIATGKTNEAAINLYKKLGYEVTDNFGIFKDDDVCICMKKRYESLI